MAFPTTLDTDVDLHQVINNLSTTLNASYTTPATTVTLVDTSAFPTTGGIIYIAGERGTYTGISGNDLTGLVGIGGNYSIGATCEMLADAAHHNDIKDAVKSLQAKVGIDSSADTGSIDYILDNKPDLSATPAVALGTASAGVAGASSRQDHVHPTTGLALTADIGTTIQAYDADTSKLDVAETRSATLNMADLELIRPKLRDVSETTSVIGNTGAARTFDLTVANVFSATLDQASTFTFSNPPATGSTGYFVIELTNGEAFAITWPTSVDWEGGTAPILTAAGVDLLAFYTRDAGVTWHGMVGSTDSK